MLNSARAHRGHCRRAPLRINRSMSFFTNIRADRFITELKTATDVAAPATQKAIAKLRELGPGAIEPVTAALADADKIATVAYIEVLTGLVNQKTFPEIHRIDGHGQPARGRRRRLGAVEQPRLSADHAAGSARHRRRGQIRPARCHHRASLAAFGARNPGRRLQAGSQRKGGAVPHPRRARHRQRPAGARRPPQRQGPGRAPAHHQYPVALPEARGPARAAAAAQGHQQAGAGRHAGRARQDGRPDRDRTGVRAAARPGNRRAEQGHRRRHPRQRSGHDQVPDPGAQGRKRVRAPRRGGSAQRNRQRQVGQGTARSGCRRRLVGAQPRRGCARQDRRPESRRSRAAAGRRPGRRHPPRRGRDPQPDQGRSRRRAPHRGHQRQGLVGQRTRGRCAGRNRQQARRAAAHRNARHDAAEIAAGGRARARPPRRPQGHRRRAAHAVARRKRHPARGHLLAREARRRTPAREHPRADPGADRRTPNKPWRRPRCARCPISTRDSRGSGTRLSSTQNRSPASTPPPVSGHRPEGATQAAEPPHYSQPAAGRRRPPPPRPRPEAPPPAPDVRSRHARSSCPSRTCSAR